MNKTMKKTVFGVSMLTALAVAGGIFAAQGKTVPVNAEGTTIVLDAKSFGLTSTASTAESTYAVDGVNYVVSSGAKAQSSTSATNAFSSNASILIGKSGAYIYNSTPLPTNIASFEVYSNAGSSTKVSVQVDFSTEPLSSKKSTADWSKTLNTANTVYPVGSVPENAKYFRYSVTNANNSQVQFKITLAEGVADTLTRITAELKDSSKVWNEGETITLDDINVYAVYSVSGPALVTEGITIENNTLSAGENAVTLSYAGKTCDLAVTAAARIVESIDVVGDMTQKSYSLGSSWNLDGLSLSVAYNTGDPIAVSLDDTRVTYTVNPAKADSTSITSLTISGEFDGVSFTKSIEGIDVHEPYYTLVSDEAKLYPGMKFHITANNGAYAAGTLSNNLLQKADFDPYSNSTVAGATLFELQGTADNWNIVSGSKNLESSAAKSMKYVTTDAPWKITIGEAAKATILKNSTVGKILYNVGSPRFTTYTSSPNATMLLPQLYTVSETDNILAFVRDYLRMGDTTMVDAGTGACVADGYYAAAKAALSKLTSEERAAFQNNDEGKYTAALARYRAWAAASGDQTPFDGSATFESKGLSIAPGKESASSSNTAIIIAACAIGTLSAGSLLFLRKKKQDRE